MHREAVTGSQTTCVHACTGEAVTGSQTTYIHAQGGCNRFTEHMRACMHREAATGSQNTTDCTLDQPTGQSSPSCPPSTLRWQLSSPPADEGTACATAHVLQHPPCCVLVAHGAGLLLGLPAHCDSCSSLSGRSDGRNRPSLQSVRHQQQQISANEKRKYIISQILSSSKVQYKFDQTNTSEKEHIYKRYIRIHLNCTNTIICLH